MHRHRQLQLPSRHHGLSVQAQGQVIALATQCSKPDMVLFLGTRAGSECHNLLQLNTSAAQSLKAGHSSQKPLNWRLKCSSMNRASSFQLSAHSRAAAVVASATQLSMLSEADLHSQFQMLFQQSRGKGDMRSVLASKLNQAEGAFQQLIACHLAGLRQPACAIEKEQDGLPISKVRMKSALEGRNKGHCKTKQAAPTAVIDVSALSSVMPKPKQSSKKRSFKEMQARQQGECSCQQCC